ncbi:MAG: hypothetical protein NZ765_05585 [Anaerolineae bacterium]|nr:hypothetical protein [Anaerolineae bacterium]MDW8069966.1 hypothetical protein [Anaerolineae bacterium]
MSFPIRVYTLSYQISGRFASNEAFLTWLNNPQKQTLDLAEAHILVLDPQAKLERVAQPLVTVPKGQIVAISMSTPEGEALLTLPARAELAVLYTPRYVIQGYLHPSGDMPLSNLLNVIGGTFVPVTHAQLHAVVPTREISGDTARLIMVNRAFIDCYHPRV